MIRGTLGVEGRKADIVSSAVDSVCLLGVSMPPVVTRRADSPSAPLVMAATADVLGEVAQP